ncbi:aminotransferase class V-fold PLP-dependent enzyme [Lachnospiraceae bacterium MD1]|uniref:Aminotransferase class V-fold PLP-dependent enzyme n=1 Tax=Variimorphobacter saccharofermentans TaxID=2755051 RepID=A0A839K084_9FIRM|nr:aminotransferase class I/II-fold pyridoxal phosphate-dependent enzyme [Variimorphobacter saccharofermentans]MBB2183325.1 aminotransferase class V-fold PLP-dependent enzyme [Variimorphobacter saccharofermentans]
MISFMNDYSECAHPRIMKMLMEANCEQNAGYGEDIHSEKAREYIKEHLQNKDVDIHFIPGGTQTNLLVISSFLRPHQCVIAAATGHINVHETGAIEATGHKVIGIPVKDGKLTPDAVRQALDYHTDEHMVQPKMVYISDTTEVGTVYTKAELNALHDICRKNELLLYMDGARLASALTSRENDMELNDIAELTDVFYIGGTKNGALLGEALVICNQDLKEDFRYLMKQRGAMMAKGFVIGMQFEALFQDRLFYELGQYANQRAEKIADTLITKGYSFYMPPCSNQLFPILSKEKITQLSEKYQFIVMDEIDEDHNVIRLVTSWATTKESVEELCRDL